MGLGMQAQAWPGLVRIRVMVRARVGARVSARARVRAGVRDAGAGRRRTVAPQG